MINGLKSNSPLLVQAICLLGLFLFGLMMDSARAISLYWPSVGIMALLGLIFTLPHLFTSHRRRALGVFAVYLFAFLCLRFLPLSPVKPYTRFFDHVAKGMTTDEVTALYHHYFPKNGRFRQPDFRVYISHDNTKPIDYSEKTFHYNLDLNDGRYDAETISIDFKNDKVFDKAYSPD